MVKEFAYNGLTEKELNSLSLEKLLAVFPARARRSLTRGINDNKRKLIKEIKTAKTDKSSTPIKTHYSLVKKALLAKKHVFVEKPISMNITQANELIKIGIPPSANCSLT